MFDDSRNDGRYVVFYHRGGMIIIFDQKGEREKTTMFFYLVIS